MKQINIKKVNIKKVNIIIGRFQPITKGHMKCIDEVYRKLHIPTIIVIVEAKKQDQRHPFVTYELVDMYKKMFKNDPRIIDIVVSKNANIVDIGKKLYDMGYSIRSWVCGTDRYDSYLKMSTKYHDDAMLDDDFELIEIKRGDEDISATKLRNAIINNDFDTFVRLFPAVQSPNIYFNKFKAMMAWMV